METRAKKSRTTTDSDERAALSAALGSPDAEAHLVLAWRRKAPAYDARYVEIDSGLSGEFLKLAREEAAALASERALVPYDSEWPLRETEYFRLADDEIPAPELFEDLKDFLNLERFDKRLLTKPRLYVVAVQTPDGTALFGRRMAYLKVLGRQRSTFSAVWNGETFSKLDRSVATFAKNFDWVRFGEAVFVLDAKGFHDEFRDAEGVKEAVAEHVAAITKKIEIKGADRLIERCQANVQMASKLKRVAESGIWDRSADELRDYAEEYELEIVWDVDALVFDGSIESQWSILKLLDEDRTEGPVSGRHYESSTKRRLDN